MLRNVLVHLQLQRTFQAGCRLPRAVKSCPGVSCRDSLPWTSVVYLLISALHLGKGSSTELQVQSKSNSSLCLTALHSAKWDPTQLKTRNVLGIEMNYDKNNK